jgi:4-hydroxythreonine-4-phosphate dehydrogenase
MKRVAITTGDPDGIGFEVTAKALEKLGPRRGFQFYLFRSSSVSNSFLKKISKKFRRQEFTSWPEAYAYQPKNTSELIEIVSPAPPAFWVETAAQACRLGALDALVTAPLSKQSILQAGLKDLGHTDILKRVCGSTGAFMGFAGEKFNVVLATGHIPLSDVTEQLTSERIVAACEAALAFREQLDPKRRSLPIALLGLNPHAGDFGLIGLQEDGLFKKALSDLKSRKVPVIGPMVPDVAFIKKNWSKFSVFVACYHDQGLIPFKAFHGFDSGVHLTLGLSLKRTSVDHGTAKDIFNQNIANPGSMISALQWAIKWVKSDDKTHRKTR